MTKEEAQALADKFTAEKRRGMIFRVIEVEDGWAVEQNCTEEFAREIYARYR